VPEGAEAGRQWAGPCAPAVRPPHRLPEVLRVPERRGAPGAGMLTRRSLQRGGRKVR